VAVPWAFFNSQSFFPLFKDIRNCIYNKKVFLEGGRGGGMPSKILDIVSRKPETLIVVKIKLQYGMLVIIYIFFVV
jgi:hypothetical protein